MELQREIRAFYVKTTNTRRPATQEIIDSLWELSRDFPVVAIDLGPDYEVMIHAALDFSLESWNDAVRYLKSVMSLLDVKSGYIAVRKITASADALKTEIEAYKVTRRGIYNVELPERPDFIEDIIRFSGSNKKLQQIDVMEKLFRFIEEQENNKEGEE